MSEPRQLTPEESALLLAAILNAAMEGDNDVAQAIAGLADDPDRIDEIVAGAEPTEGGE